MKIITFGYKKCVGKNECAKFLGIALKLNCPGTKIVHVSFAEKLKGICYQLFSWADLQPGVYYETHRTEKEQPLPEMNLSPRDIWVGVGNALRTVYQNTWIKYALKKRDDCDFAIISDLRFKNEANAIRAEDGILVKINRPDIEQGTDPAEVDLDDFDDWNYVIENNGELGDLNKQMVMLAETLCQKKEE